MSETVTKLISVYPHSKAVFNHADELRRYIGTLTDAPTEVYESSSIDFIDCGTEIKEIICPCCRKRTDSDWWNEKVDEYYQNGFSDLMTEMYCCGARVSLNDLDYRPQCGFASAVFKIMGELSLSPEELSTVTYIVNEDIRIIAAKE